MTIVEIIYKEIEIIEGDKTSNSLKKYTIKTINNNINKSK